MAQTPNLVTTPQKGLVPLGTFGNSNPMMQSGTLSSNGQGGFNLISGKTPQTVQPTAPAPLQSNGQGGFIIPNNAPMGVGGGNGMTPVPNSSGNGGGAVTPPASVNPGSNGTATGVPMTVYNKDGTTSTFNTGTPGDAAKAQAALAAGGSMTDPNAQNGGTTNGSQPGQNPVIKPLIDMSSSPSGNFSTAQNTANTSAQNLLNSTPAQNAAVVAAKQNIQDLQNEYADQTGLIGNSPIGLSEQGGEQGLLNSQYASKLGAAQTALANVLQGNAQQQAAYTGAGNIANTEAGQATTQQGTQQAGLTSAVNAAQPSPYGPAQAPYSSYTGAGTQPVNTGQGGTALGNVGGAQTFQQTMVPAYQSAVNDSNAFVNWLNTPASQGGGQGVNPSQFNVGNALMNWATGQNYSNPQYPQLATYLNDFSSKLSSILGGNSGEITNYKQQLVNSMLNGTADTDSIQKQMQTMLDVGTQTMQGYASTYGVNWNPPGGSSASGSSGNIFGSFSGGK